MILKNSKPLLIICSLIALLFLAIITAGIYSIRSKDKNTSELLLTADKVAGATVLAEFVERVRVEARTDVEALDNLALSSDKIIFFIENIEEAGRAIGLRTNIASVDRVEDKKSADPSSFRIVVEGEGEWQRVFSFLAAIESLPYRVMIDEVSLAKNELDWKSRIVLSVYSFD